MGEGCSSEAQPGEDGWQGGDYCDGAVVVVVGGGGDGEGGGGGDSGGGGGNSSDNEFRLTLANGCDTACQGGGVSYWLARRLILARVHEALGVYCT